MKKTSKLVAVLIIKHSMMVDQTIRIINARQAGTVEPDAWHTPFSDKQLIQRVIGAQDMLEEALYSEGCHYGHQFVSANGGLLELAHDGGASKQPDYLSWARYYKTDKTV